MGAWFRTNATSSEGLGRLGNPSNCLRVFRSCRERCTRKRRQSWAIVSTPCTTRSAASDILAHAYAQCRSNKGAPGVDGQEFADVAGVRGGIGRFGELDALRQGGELPTGPHQIECLSAKASRPLGMLDPARSACA